MFDSKDFGGDILARNKNKLGSWAAYYCDGLEDLYKQIRLGDNGCNKEYLLKRIPNYNSIWPLAYLADIRVYGHARRKGFGSKALLMFKEAAISRGCCSALANVGFISWEERDKNISFYLKNGWTLLTQENDMPYPLDLVYLRL